MKGRHIYIKLHLFFYIIPDNCNPLVHLVHLKLQSVLFSNIPNILRRKISEYTLMHTESCVNFN